MASLVEIPQELFAPDRRVDFIAWISELPNDRWVKRQLIHGYAHRTNVHFTLTQMSAMMDPTGSDDERTQ